MRNPGRKTTTQSDVLAGLILIFTLLSSSVQAETILASLADTIDLPDEPAGTSLCEGGTPNGVFEPGEECDTGDPDPGDGCDSNCRIVDGWICDNPVAIGPLSFEAYAGAGASWSVTSDGRTAEQSANTANAAFALIDAPSFESTYTFETQVNTSADDDFIGLALGMNPGEVTPGFGSDTDYLVLSWKQADQDDARRGLALLHVFGGTPVGENNNSPLWTYGANPQPPVSVLAWADVSGDTGWADFIQYEWTIDYQQDSLVVTVDGVEEFNVQASDWPERFPDGFPDGRLAFYSFNQPSSLFTITGPFEPSICTPAVPGPPIIGTAEAGNAEASVSFLPPEDTGGSAIIGYTATSSPDGQTGTCTESPCTVSGLSNGTAYTFTVYATNDSGDGPESAPSNEVTPLLPQYTVGGTVQGLEGTGLILQNNGADDQAITDNGTFAFLPQDDGSDFQVTVATQPSNPQQICNVINGSGTLAGSDFEDIEVICGGPEIFNDRFELE